MDAIRSPVPSVNFPWLNLSAQSASFAALVLLVCMLAFKYPDRYIGTHDRGELPGPKGVPLIGNLLQILPHAKRMTFWMDDAGGTYGPLYTFTMPGWSHSVVINHLDWLNYMKKKDTTVYTKGMHTIAIFSKFLGKMSPFATNGMQWRSNRKAISSIFSVKKFDDQVSGAMQEVLSTARELLLTAADENMTFDWNNFSSRVALAVLYRMVFGVGLSALCGDPKCLDEPDVLVDALKTCNTISSGRLYNPFWKLTDKITLTGRRFAKARSAIYWIAEDLLHRHRAQAEQGAVDEGDFITALIDHGVSDSEICGIIVTLFFAGHDNFLNVLGWALHELSKAPQWPNRMREEAAQNNSSGDVITLADIFNFPIHLAVFYEVQHLWPGVPKNARYFEENNVLPAIPSIGQGPVKLFKGENVLWSDRWMMHSKEVWGANAGEFDPGRHLDPDGKFIKPAPPKFHAFGAGPRYCPGAQVGVYEFVAFWMGMLPYIDVVPVRVEERTMKDSFTSTMDGEFEVKIKRV